MSSAELFRRLRALTTDRWDEAAFVVDDQGGHVQVRVELREEQPASGRSGC